jgi:hypothetical protein
MNLQDTNPRAFWNLVKQLADETNTDPSSLFPDDEWFQHFHKLTEDNCEQFDQSFYAQSVNMLADLETKLQNSELPFTLFSDVEVENVIRKLRPGKSEGLDCIKNEMLTCAAPIITPILVKLFNSIGSRGDFPKMLTEGFIVPLPKCKNPSSPNDFRGITISSSLGKVFVSLLLNRMENAMHLKNRPNIYQAGFRKGFRTADNIFILQTLVSKLLRQGRKLFVCFVDFQKAFDTVWREGLYLKLIELGVDYNTYNCIKNMFLNNSVCVRVEGQLSDAFQTRMGVMQGNNLSPLLFNLFIDSLPDEICKSGSDPPQIGNVSVPCLFYADDLVLLSTTADGLQNALNTLELFCNRWRLSINIAKTKVIIFNKSGRICRQF